jgi:hypothetical protein
LLDDCSGAGRPGVAFDFDVDTFSIRLSEMMMFRSHLGPRWMMRVRRDSANHNRPAGKFGKATAPDLDGGRAVADAAFERDSGCSGLGCARLPA